MKQLDQQQVTGKPLTDDLKSQKGSLPGAILLITGCCIGAGMLGLPMMTAMAGFRPTLLMFFLSWLFMTTTALLLLEVNLWFAPGANLISMAERTLGVVGKGVAWVCFVFLFYALGVAYIAGSGELISDFFLQSVSLAIPKWMGGLLVSLLFGLFVFIGVASVDLCNRLLMLGLAISYVILVIVGLPHVNIDYLAHVDFNVAIVATPFMIISFGFHNLIPSLTSYLRHDVKRLRLAIIIGSLIPLLIYLVWEAIILGLVPVYGEGGFLEVIENESLATDLLKKSVGASWVLDAAQLFSLFAILTSFLGNSLSFVDFLADGFKLQKSVANKFCLCLLVIAPPFGMAVVYPGIFLKALGAAGAFGAVTLFGILPALMVWRGRYLLDMKGVQIVPGGKVLLAVILTIALSIIGLQFR